MSTSQKAGTRIVLQVDRFSGATPDYETIGEVNDVSGPGLTGSMEDSNAVDEVWGSRIVSMLNLGDVTFTIGWRPDLVGHKELIYDFKNKLERTYRITFLDITPELWEFNAFVSGFVPNWSNPGKLTAAVTLAAGGTPGSIPDSTPT